MKKLLLFLGLVIQVSSLLPAPKRNLQSTQKRLLIEQVVLYSQHNNSINIVEACPTKPPKRFYGSYAKARLQRANDNLRTNNEQLREAIKTIAPGKDIVLPAIILYGIES